MVTEAPACRILHSDLKKKIEKYHEEEWNRTWNICSKARETHHHIPKIFFGLYKELLSRDRESLRILCGTITGHNGCRKHIMKFKPLTSINCRFCDMAVESNRHLLYECTFFEEHREHFLVEFNINDTAETTSGDLIFKFDQLINFVQSNEIFAKMMKGIPC